MSLSPFPPLELGIGSLTGHDDKGNPMWEATDMSLLFMTGIYAVVLFTASGYISGGSELLLLVPAVSGLVGTIVLPILGAVPDGVMMLFSGLGARAEAQDSISVGVGALAGSTVMLLTIPWFIAIMYGRVPLDASGNASYSNKADLPSTPFFKTGVSFQKAIPQNAKIMLMTTVLYLVIQVPAYMAEGEHPLGAPKTDATTKATIAQADSETLYAQLGLGLAILSFTGYLVYCFKDANADKQLEAVIEGIKTKTISLQMAMKFLNKEGVSNDAGGSMKDCLKPLQQQRLKTIMKPFFARFDTDKSGKIDQSEFRFLMLELGHAMTDSDVNKMFKSADTDSSGNISFEEFTELIYTYMSADRTENQSQVKSIPAYDAEEGADEEEEVPEDLADLPESVQQKRIILRACWMMAFGTTLVLIFSDPMVENLGAIGKRLDISAFYVSFVLAPFASNASELLAAYTYAVKKTQKAMTTSLSTLVGAAIMNNTFCLAIFFAMIWKQELAWQFTAETVAIIVIQWVIGILCIKKSTHTAGDAFIIISCYPACLAIVYVLENFCGLD